MVATSLVPNIFRIKRNDTGPSIQCTLRYSPTEANKLGAPIPLTGCTVRFHMRRRGTSTVKVNAAAVVVTPTAGEVRYDWQTGDTDTSGQYEAEWEITTGAGQVVTVPSFGFTSVEIFDDIA